MKKTQIFFRVDGNSQIGLGHLVRCIALALMLKNDFDICFACLTIPENTIAEIEQLGFKLNIIESEEDFLTSLTPKVIIVLDHYGLDSAYQKSIKDNGCKLVCIDDLHIFHFYADVVLNVSNSIIKNNYSCEKYTKLLLGTDYALLRPAFLRCAAESAKKTEQIRSVFINMGGADENNNTLKFLNAIITADKIKQIHIVIGLVNPYKSIIEDFIATTGDKFDIKLYSNINADEMINILSESQLAICPASGISMELCAVGICMITGYTANNQKDLLKGLIDNKCAVNLGDINIISQEDIIKFILQVMLQSESMNEMIFNQKKLIDGHSGDRVREVFESL